MTPERRLWSLIETCHAVVYFAPERVAVYRDAGFIGGWMPYFATRSAALGMVAPQVVTACFYFFKHQMVARALPDAWNAATPDDALTARLAVVDLALRRICRDLLGSSELREAARTAIDVAHRAPVAGRPMFAAHVALPVPTDPHLQMFWACTALRELRGDGHIAALQVEGLTGLEANALMESLRLVPTSQRTFRGWSDDDWEASVDRLRTRGLLGVDGRPTARGRSLKKTLDSHTERLASLPFPMDGQREIDLMHALERIADAVNAAAAIPYPNAMGLPAPVSSAPRRKL